jgi:CheY-like chemotaxis protein
MRRISGTWEPAITMLTEKPQVAHPRGREYECVMAGTGQRVVAMKSPTKGWSQDAVSRSLVRRANQQSGYRCSVAYNGAAGLLRALELRPDMILSGVKNGDGPNGIEMAIRILVEAPETKILLFSGQAASADLLEAAIASGHDLDLVAKPVHPIALIHWCDSGGVRDVHSCQWCHERWVGSGGACPHGERRDCACAWCRALAAGRGR